MRHQVWRSFLHWLVADIPDGQAPSAGRTLMPYKGPAPVRGVHRCAAREHATCAAARMRAAAVPLLTRFVCWIACALSCGVDSYVLLLFQQPAAVGAQHAAQLEPPERNSFNVCGSFCVGVGAAACLLAHVVLHCSAQVRTFASDNKLAGPVGVNFFEVEKTQ